jgi:enoyl-CoA hydratase
MAYQDIIFEKDGNIGIIRFNRPKALNAITENVLDELDDAVSAVEKDESIRALVLTGEGDKAFVAGADIGHLAKLSAIGLRAFSGKGQDLLFRIEGLHLPVIACVNGFALGGGLEIAMACDFIYASEDAKFGLPEINLGIFPGFGGTQRLPRIVGKALAKELSMTGGMLGADEARGAGIVNRVFPADQLWEETMKTAGAIASKGRVALKGLKDCINRGYDVDLRDGCYIERETFGLTGTSPDFKEGMEAFLEKRKPEFKGQLS